MNTKIKDFEKKILTSVSNSEKADIRFEMKKYINSLSAEEYQIYRNEAIAEMKSDAEVIEKLLQAYELMKNNMLQYS